MNLRHKMLEKTSSGLNPEQPLLTHVSSVLCSWRNQSIDLHCRSVEWFLYESNIGPEQLKLLLKILALKKSKKSKKWKRKKYAVKFIIRQGTCLKPATWPNMESTTYFYRNLNIETKFVDDPNILQISYNTLLNL